MICFMREAVSFMFMLMFVTAVGAKDLSAYPCTVFSGEMCFRLPAGTALNYSVPSDFDLYRVSKDQSTVAVLYIGYSPRSPKAGAAIQSTRAEKNGVMIYRGEEAGVESFDIYITPDAKDAATIHISAAVDPSSKKELSELLSSLRPCRPIKAGGQRCPQNTVWSSEFANLLKP